MNAASPPGDDGGVNAIPATQTMMPLPAAEGVPEWVHLLPAGTFSGGDGRGPYRVADTRALIATSMKPGKLVLDEMHATDLAVLVGGAAPARGWITEMEARDDGIWGRVKWTASGQQLMSEEAYRGVSPNFEYTADGRVTRIKRASLTNAPNLTLTSLHCRQDHTTMDLQPFRDALGLTDLADEAAVLAAVQAAAQKVALHSEQLATFARTIGRPAETKPAELVTALQALTGKPGEMAALQSQIATLEGERKRDRAERAIEKARGQGRAIRPEDEETFVAMHMENPERAEWMMGRLLSLHSGGVDLSRQTRTHVDGGAAKQAAGLLGFTPAQADAFAAAQAAKGGR